MSICDSEENRKKLAWLVPGYILLAWFFCVLFQPLGIHSPSSRYHPRLTKYGEQVIYLAQDESNPRHCQNNGSIITLEEGQTSAVVLRLGRVHPNRDPFICRLKVRNGQRWVFNTYSNRPLSLIVLQFLYYYNFTIASTFWVRSKRPEGLSTQRRTRK